MFGVCSRNSSNDDTMRCIIRRIDDSRIQITNPVEAENVELVSKCQAHHNGAKSFSPMPEHASVTSEHTHWNFKLLHKMLTSQWGDPDSKSILVCYSAVIQIWSP